MDQATQDGIRRYKAAIERIRSGESESEEVDLPSGRVRLTHDRENPNGVKIEVLESDRTERSGARPEPEVLEAMSQVKEVMERFRAGDIDDAEIPLPTGGTMKLSRDHRAPGAFTVRTPEGGPSMFSIPFKPGPTRPEGYPEDLPFLPDVTSTLSSMEGQEFRTLSWFITGDHREHLGELRRQLTEMGWEDGGESNVTTAAGTMTIVEFRKGDMARTLMVSRFGERCQIKLMEQPRKHTGSESPVAKDSNAL